MPIPDACSEARSLPVCIDSNELSSLAVATGTTICIEHAPGNAPHLQLVISSANGITVLPTDVGSYSSPKMTPFRSTEGSLIVAVEYWWDAGIDDSKLLQLYAVDQRNRIFSAESYSFATPIVRDVNGDGIVEVIVWDDVFAINHPAPRAPAWPIVYTLSGEGTVVKQLLRLYPQFLTELANQGRAIIPQIRALCGDDGGECYYHRTAAALELQTQIFLELAARGSD